jgi:hypothetical protein
MHVCVQFRLVNWIIPTYKPSRNSTFGRERRWFGNRRIAPCMYVIRFTKQYCGNGWPIATRYSFVLSFTSRSQENTSEVPHHIKERNFDKHRQSIDTLQYGKYTSLTRISHKTTTTVKPYTYQPTRPSRSQTSRSYAATAPHTSCRPSPHPHQAARTSCS